MKSSFPLCIFLLLDVGSLVETALLERTELKHTAQDIPHTQESRPTVWLNPLGVFLKKKLDYTKSIMVALQDSCKDSARHAFCTAEGNYKFLKSVSDFAGKSPTAIHTDKRSGNLENLAEELSDYRRKGGFSFRFGKKSNAP
ncbi:hypothetical protein ANANG_G00193210 [Anguilla anguilla]|uniref:Uncharacterized protein n=1 Tax=Anguilla anguilla TaxID=7936 RepID=A0A9D3RVD6_ANGAN|nr:hypothetical protein ANANG_G00193210 [Anguilla anguilla]